MKEYTPNKEPSKEDLTIYYLRPKLIAPIYSQECKKVQKVERKNWVDSCRVQLKRISREKIIANKLEKPKKKSVAINLGWVLEHLTISMENSIKV